MIYLLVIIIIINFYYINIHILKRNFIFFILKFFISKTLFRIDSNF